MSETPETPTHPDVQPPEPSMPEMPARAILMFWTGSNPAIVSADASVTVDQCNQCFALVPQQSQAGHQDALHKGSSASYGSKKDK